jgi:predicted transcriptional regulator
MKTIISITFFLSALSLTIHAQVGKQVSNVQLGDVNNAAKNIPYLGNKVFTLFYVDPDVQDVTDPLSDALNAKKYPKEKYGAIGVVNCKDTWFPNSAILAKAKQKQNKFPESLILLDKNYTLTNSWGLGKCDNIAMIVVVGKDSKIKYIKAIKSKEEGHSIISDVLKVIDSEIK